MKFPAKLAAVSMAAALGLFAVGCASSTPEATQSESSSSSMSATESSTSSESESVVETEAEAATIEGVWQGSVEDNVYDFTVTEGSFTLTENWANNNDQLTEPIGDVNGTVEFAGSEDGVDTWNLIYPTGEQFATFQIKVGDEAMATMTVADPAVTIEFTKEAERVE